MGVEAEIRALMEPILDDLGVELVEVDWASGRLRLTVDTEDGIGTAVLATATRNISRELDTEDPIPGKFTLEVTSPGLERQLRRPEHFTRALGGQVTIKLSARAADDGDRRIRGQLTAVDSDSIVIAANDGTTRTIDMSDIAKARTVFEWGPKSKEATTR
jgi:ribosome maturation factor RimP